MTFNIGGRIGPRAPAGAVPAATAQKNTGAKGSPQTVTPSALPLSASKAREAAIRPGTALKPRQAVAVWPNFRFELTAPDKARAFDHGHAPDKEGVAYFKAGLTPKQGEQFSALKKADRELLKQLVESHGLTIGEALELHRDLGKGQPRLKDAPVALQSSTALALRTKGYSEANLLRFMALGGDAKQAAKYQNVGAAPNTALGLQAAQIMPSEVAAFKKLGVEGHQLLGWSKQASDAQRWFPSFGTRPEGFSAATFAIFTASGGNAKLAEQYAKVGATRAESVVFLHRGILPEEVAHDKKMASMVRPEGFSEATFSKFIRSGGNTTLAAQYAEAGATPEESVVYLRRGVSPQEAAQFEAAERPEGFDITLFSSFTASGGDATLAAEYSKAGATPEESVVYRSAEISPQQVKECKQMGYDAPQILALKKKGLIG